MPTISQLAPATAASDSDELVVNQAGTTRKVTRSQILAGVQPEIAARSGALLGRSSKGTGAPENLTVGENLILSGGTLAATATPFVISALPTGVVPASGDLVPVSQGGKDVAVPYQQFLSGLSYVTNIDLSQAVVFPTGSGSAVTLSDFAAGALSTTGGTMTGPLVLNADPVLPLEASTKAYVDQAANTALPRTGGTVTGVLSLVNSPILPNHAATKLYVDTVADTRLPVSGGTMAGVLNLEGDPVLPLQAAPKQYVDERVLRSGDVMSGPLTLSADPVAVGHAATKRYVDVQVAAAVPLAGGTLTGGLTLASDPVAALQAAPKQYVDRRVSRSGDTLTGPLILAADPTTTLGAATKGYVDTQVATTLPKAGGTLSGALTLSGDPVSLEHAATKRYVDNQFATALPLAGGTLTGALTLAGNPAAAQHAANKQYVDGQVATLLPLTGGTLSGALTLAGSPTAPNHAATKQYVDANPGRDGVINVKLPPYNAQLNGIADDTAAFKAAYQAAAPGGTIYVPNGVAVLQSPGSWGMPLTKRVKWIVDGTTLPNGTSLADAIPRGTGPASLTLPGVVTGHSGVGTTVSQAGSQSADFSAHHTSYIVDHNGGSSAVIANARSDTIIYNSPANYVWAGLDRLIWAGIQTPAGSPSAQHVARYVQTVRQTVATDETGKALPQPELWAACLEYRDVTGRPSSWVGESLTVEMDWIGNGPDDAGTRQIQSLVIGQHDTSGTPVEVANVIGVYLAQNSTGNVHRVFNIGVPFSTAVLDTTYARQMPGAAAIRLAAGHSIAFESSASNRLAFDSNLGILRWYQGGLSYPVGKGISVGWQNVAAGSTTLGAFLAGNIVFLVGSSNYTISLPSASTVAAGTGFTFSALGSGSVTIAPAGTETIDAGPIVLRQHDRYHIVSDGATTWREIFRCNAVSPRFSGPPVLPSYPVASLPATAAAGAKAFATNGRKPSDAAGAGTGVEVFYDGTKWISVCSGSQVAA